MKKSSPKKFAGSKLKKKRGPKITWFGIDIYRIGLGVAFVGAIVSFLLVKQQKSFEEQQTQVLAAENHMPIMMQGYNDHWATLSARPTCIPRPVGFNPIAASTSGKYKEILSRLCPLTTRNSTASGEMKYKGCNIEITCNSTSTESNGHCMRQIICPSGTPFPPVTFPAMRCVPRPPCLDNQHGPKCLIAEPTGGWCPQLTKIPEPTCGPQPSCGNGQVCPSPQDDWCHHVKSPLLMQQIPSSTASSSTSITTNLAQWWNNLLRSIFSKK